MNFDLYIFDLDGTLVRLKAEYIHMMVQKALDEFGILATKTAIGNFWFGTHRNNILKEKFGVEPKKFWDAYKNYDTPESRKEYLEVYRDVGFIEQLKDAGYMTAIVTGSPEEYAFMEIDLIGAGNFDCIIIAHETGSIAPKPDPHGIKECLKMCGVKKEKAVYTGNAQEDLLSAKSAEVFDVLIRRGDHVVGEYIKPSLEIYSLHELRQLTISNL